MVSLYRGVTRYSRLNLFRYYEVLSQYVPQRLYSCVGPADLDKHVSEVRHDPTNY